MDELPGIITHAEAEARLRELLDDEGIDQPDEVLHEVDPDEVVFLWHERKVAIVVELDPDGVEAARSRTAALRPPV